MADEVVEVAKCINGRWTFQTMLPMAEVFGRELSARNRRALDAIYNDPTLDERIKGARARDEERLRSINSGSAGSLASKVFGWVLGKVISAADSTLPPSQPNTPYPNASKDDPPLGKVVVHLGKHSTPTDNQKALLEWLKGDRGEITSIVREAVFKHYRDVEDACRDGEENSASVDILVPKIERAEELDDCYRLNEVILDPSQPIVGLVFECTWDDEHGLGVRIEDKIVADTGDAEVANIFT